MGDVLFVHGYQFNPMKNWMKYNEQHTLIKDLSIPAEQVWNSFGKHLRKFIARSENEGAIVRIFRGKEITKAQIEKAADIYHKMKKAKGLDDYLNKKLAWEYARQDNLLLSIAMIDGQQVGFKASIVDDKNLRGWVSAFSFREEGADSSAIGRAHRNLEWQTMKYCMTTGIKNFDFGGVNSFDEPNGIAKFKMEFEKENKVTYSNYLVPNSFFGKVALWFIRCKSRL